MGHLLILFVVVFIMAGLDGAGWAKVIGGGEFCTSCLGVPGSSVGETISCQLIWLSGVVYSKVQCKILSSMT